jgi:hypothetical protein
MKLRVIATQMFLRAVAVIGLSALVLGPWSSQAQLTPGQINDLKSVAGNRVEALTVLGGDYGLAGGTYMPDSSDYSRTTLSVNKFGGSGDVGDPMPIGDTGIGWQPRVQGSMGTVDAERRFRSASPLDGDKNKYETFAIQFGGGARFWFTDALSVAPTFMGMYGHTENDYNANSANGQALHQQAKSAGIIDWEADTWTIRPAANLQYILRWDRTIFTLASDFAYFHTESFRTSNSNVDINGDSESWRNMIDVDVPLGKQLWGHELRTGGYFARTELYDSLSKGLNTDHIYEVHGRIVLDFLGELWKVQWIGIGVSYLWGSNFTGYSYGADVAFQF